MTPPPPAVVAAFCAAFDRRDEDALIALLADDVTAEVLGSGFGTETGPEDVRAKSIRHMLSVDDWGPLAAEKLVHAGDVWIVFVGGEPPGAECAARVEVGAGRITRIEYLVAHFRAVELAAIDAAWRSTRGDPVD